MANLSIQILAGVPDCIHANQGYVYSKPAVQLTEDVNAYSVSPSVTTYTQGNAIKYSSLEESAYTSVTPAPILKQIVAAPVFTKSYVQAAAPIVTKAYIPPPSPPVYTKSYVSPVAPYATVAPIAPVASIAPTITKSYLPPISQVAYTAPISKLATYTPTSNIVPIPAVKSYSYPTIPTGYVYAFAGLFKISLTYFQQIFLHKKNEAFCLLLL